LASKCEASSVVVLAIGTAMPVRRIRAREAGLARSARGVRYRSSGDGGAAGMTAAGRASDPDEDAAHRAFTTGHTVRPN
jgi:hypothetical protein